MITMMITHFKNDDQDDDTPGRTFCFQNGDDLFAMTEDIRQLESTHLLTQRTESFRSETEFAEAEGGNGKETPPPVC